MQSDGKIQMKLLFLMIYEISVFIIVALLPYDVNAQTLHNQNSENSNIICDYIIAEETELFTYLLPPYSL